ncbi:MAG: HAD family hydrolase [Rhodothermales bacterium]
MTEKLVIFDCDGVLVDSELISLGLLIEYCSKYDVQVSLEEACEIFLGKPVNDSASEVNRIMGTSVPDVDIDLFQEQIFERFDKELNAVEGVIKALEQIDYPVCVASSSNLSRIQLSLRKTGLDKFFTKYLFSTDMVARGKPHPDVFLYACERMNVHPKDAIVIEDSPAGLMAAKAAGIKTIAFAGGVHAEQAKLIEKLLPLSPDILIHNMMELPPLIESLLME